jgi:hypothetical protein
MLAGVRALQHAVFTAVFSKRGNTIDDSIFPA